MGLRMPKIQDVLHRSSRPAVAHDRPKGVRPALQRRAMSDDQNNPNAMHELKTPEPTESVVRSMPLLEDAERLATQLEQKVFEIDRRRQSIREELERLDALHSWMNARRHEAASIVARMKAASSNEGS